jgi:hypothetical protein
MIPTACCRYEGGWRSDKMHGRGTYWKFVPVKAGVAGASGASRGAALKPGTAVRGNLVKIYEGDYSDGRRHGTGRLHYSALAAAAAAAGTSSAAGSSSRSSGRSSSAGLFDSGLSFSPAGAASGSLGSSGVRSSASASSSSVGASDTREVYEGEFEADLPHGHGTMRYVDGSMYTGQWRAGRRHGHGVLVLGNGDRYIGSWEGDMKHGPGRHLYYSRDRVYAGEWVADVPRSGEMSGMSPEERATVGDTSILAAATGGSLSALAATTAAAAAAAATEAADQLREAHAPSALDIAGPDFAGGSGLTAGLDYHYGDTGRSGSRYGGHLPSPNPVSLPALSVAAPDAVLRRALVQARTEGLEVAGVGFPNPAAAGSASGAGAPGGFGGTRAFLSQTGGHASSGVGGAVVGPDGLIVTAGMSLAVPEEELHGEGAEGGGSEGVQYPRFGAGSGVGFGGEGSIALGEGSGIGEGLPALYHIDPSSIQLSGEEVGQLTAAFRTGDAGGTGRIPPDAGVLAAVLGSLGIRAAEDDVAALLRELTAMEREVHGAGGSSGSGGGASDSLYGGPTGSGSASGGLSAMSTASRGGGVGDSNSLLLPPGSEGGISFPIFAACMARLRE